MSDVELKLTANLDQATKEVRGFRKDYADLVHAVEKPLRQVNAFRELESSLESTSREMRTAKDRLRELAAELARTAEPTKELQADYRNATQELKRLERQEERQVGQLRKQQAELKRTGIDMRNLAGEQKRLQAELGKQLVAGRADASLTSAKKALGVGAIEQTQQQLVALRRQYQLVAADATLTGRQRSEAEAAYRARVSETLEELRKLRASIQTGAAESAAAAAAEMQRNAAAREGIRSRAAALGQVTREQRLANIEAAKSDLGVNRYRALQAELKSVRSQYQLLRTTGNLTANELAIAQRNMTQRVRETQRALREMNAEQSRSRGSAQNLLGGAAAAYTAYRTVTGVTRQADEWVEMTDRIKMASGSQEEFERGLESLRATSDRTFTNMSNNAEVFINSLTPLRERGFSNDDALKFTETLGLGLVASAAKGERATSVIEQFSGALQEGVLRGDAFNSMIRNAPALADALARGLGKTREELAAMAKAGELTTDVFVPALISQLDELGQAVDGMNVTVGDAGTILQNAWKEAVGKADIEPLTDALRELAATIRDPAVAEGITAIASMIVGLGAAAVTAGSEFLELMGRVGLLASSFKGSVPELEKIDRKIADIDRSLAGAGLNTTLAGIWYSKEELQEQRAALESARAEMLEQQTGLNAELQFLAEVGAAAAQAGRDKDLSGYRTYIAELKTLQEQQVKAAEAANKKQAAAEKSALRELEKVKADRLKVEARYQEALATLGGPDDASYGAAQSLKVGARQALQAGDVEGAQRQAQAALKMLQDMAAAGENTYGFSGFIQELQAIELAANDIEQTNAEQKIESIRANMKALEEQAKALENTAIGFDLDDASVDAVRTQIQKLVAEMGKLEIVLPMRVAHPDGPIVQELPPAPGYAAGGKLRGPGTGTSDSILMWGSNGEYMQPEASVRYYGEGFMEAIRQRRLPRFAEGGLISNRAMPAIPQMNPALMQSNNPLQDWGRATLESGGSSIEVLMKRDSFDQVLRRTATKLGGTTRR